MIFLLQKNFFLTGKIFCNALHSADDLIDCRHFDFDKKKSGGKDYFCLFFSKKCLHFVFFSAILTVLILLMIVSGHRVHSLFLCCAPGGARF